MEVVAQTEAWWDSTSKDVRCVACWPNDAAVSGPLVESTVALIRQRAPLPSVSVGTPGASALRYYERKRAREERQRQDRNNAVRARHPHLGGLIVALTDDGRIPQSTQSWGSGAAGEEVVGRLLNEWAETGSGVVLHDRRIPGSTANIDHIAVASSGVWVIDTKRYSGRLEPVNRGGWLHPDWRLMVNGRDRSKLAADLAKQIAVVTSALKAEASEQLPSIHGVLCFVDADWVFLAKPFSLDGVIVAWPDALIELLSRPGEVPSDARQALADLLARRLVPA
jgi:hypothetical protein